MAAEGPQQNDTLYEESKAMTDEGKLFVGVYIGEEENIAKGVNVTAADSSMNDELEEKKEEKELKPKKRLSIFRKLKKDKMQKNEANSTEPVELTLESAGETTQESLGENGITENMETENAIKSCDNKPERKRKIIWKRKTNKKVDKSEDASTQTAKPNEAGHQIVKSEDPDFVQTVEEKDEEKPKRRSFVKRIKKFKITKSTNTTEQQDAIAEKDTTEKHTKEDNCEEIADEGVDGREETDEDVDGREETDESVDSGVINDSFHDVFDKKKSTELEVPLTATAESQLIEANSEVIEKWNEEDANNTVTDAKVTDENNREHNESSKSDLTVVTALPGATTDAGMPISVTVDTGLETDDPDVENTIETEEPVTTSEDPMGITSEVISETPNCDISKEQSNVNETTKCDEKKEQPKILDFVLIDHLDDQQKEESFYFAKKAMNVYKKAQLSRTYCQACCTVM